MHIPEFGNPFADPRRDVSKFVGQHWEHASVESFAGKRELLPGLHTIAHNHVDIDVLFAPVGADVTAAMFHGALESPDSTLPVFYDALPGVTANRIYISDPGLYLTPGATWAGYEDSNGVPLSYLLPKIIGRFHEFAGGSLVFAGEASATERFAAAFPGSRIMTPGTIG